MRGSCFRFFGLFSLLEQTTACSLFFANRFLLPPPFENFEPLNFSFPSLPSHLPPPLPRIARAGEQAGTKAATFCVLSSEERKRGTRAIYRPT